MNNPFVRAIPSSGNRPSGNPPEHWSHHQFPSEVLAEQFATAKRVKQTHVTVGRSSRTDYWVVRVRLD